MRKIATVLVSMTLLSSCANIAKEIVAPNRCKKCEVYDTETGEVLRVIEECGGSNVRLEEEAQIDAFHRMRGGNCNVDVRCTTYKKE